MSAHTPDLEYAQSNFCTGGKKQLNKLVRQKKLSFFSGSFVRLEFVYKMLEGKVNRLSAVLFMNDKPVILII